MTIYALGLAGRVAGRDRARAAAAQACVGAARRSGPEEFAPDRGCDGRLATVTALDHLSAEPFFQRYKRTLLAVEIAASMKSR